ncbi:MAG: MATE family efflux transporter [Planctomycetota bacterium]
MPSSQATSQTKARGPLWELLVVAAPVVMTMASYTIMQFVDALMVTRIGPDEVYLAAQSNGGITMWLTIAAVLGGATVINTFVSQHLGAGRPERGASYAWAGVYLAAVWALVMAPAIPFLGSVFELAGHEGRLLEIETEYAQILFGGAFFVLASRNLAHYFYGLHRPMVVMIAAFSGNLVNMVANAVLIFGIDGAPQGFPLRELWMSIAEGLGIEAMGVAGAAWGTVIGSAVELAIPVALFISPGMERRYKTRSSWRISMRPVKDIVRVGWPGGLMLVSELTCWSYLMVVLLPLAGKAAGEDPVIHNAAGWAALRYMHLSFMPVIGLQTAVTAVVGRYLGARDKDTASARAWLGLKIGMVYMGVCAVAFVLLRYPMIALFAGERTPEEASEMIRIGASVMIAAAVFQVFDAMAIVMQGALRGAGDTVYPGVVTVITSWVFIVAGGHLLIEFAPGLGSVGPWIGGAAYIISLGMLMTLRWMGGKWREIELVEEDAAASECLGAAEEAGTLPGLAPASPATRLEPKMRPLDAEASKKL